MLGFLLWKTWMVGSDWIKWSWNYLESPHRFLVHGMEGLKGWAQPAQLATGSTCGLNTELGLVLVWWCLRGATSEGASEGWEFPENQVCLNDLLKSSSRNYVASLLPHSTDYQCAPQASPDSRKCSGVVTRTHAEKQGNGRCHCDYFQIQQPATPMTHVWIRGRETDKCFSGEIGMCVHIPLKNFFFMFVFAKTFLGGDHAPWQCVICTAM